MSGVGGALSSFFGGQSGYQSNVHAAGQSLFDMPDQQKNQQMLQGALQQAGQNQVNTAPQDQTRGMQMNLGSQLAQQAMGQGPSLAGQQLQQGLQQSLLQQRAQAASGGGDTNQFLVQRQLADQGAQAQQATNAQMAMARTQEQMNAQGQLGNLTGQIRGQDQGLVGLQQQQQGINNQASQYAMSGLTGLSAQQQAGNIAYAKALQDAQTANSGINAGVAGQNAQNANAYGSAIFGGLAQGGSAALGKWALSDERQKTNVDREHLDTEMRDFLSALDPASYDYKDPSFGEGRHWSVMAQSAAKSNAGRSFVAETPNGLMLDTKKATGVALAALSHLHRRQDKVESLAARALKRG